jgi:hypothetical protein
MANKRIRQAARESGVKLWQVAERWGCNDGNFSRKLRREFTPTDISRALEIIEGLRRENETHATNANDQTNGAVPSGE